MASSPAANAENQDQFIESDSFLKDPHSRLPRYITRRKDLSSNLKVLLGELYGRYCISGNLTFKTSTLADLCGLTIDQTRRAISEGRKKAMFVTTPTGRALSYKLIDQKYPRLVNSECGPNHNQSAQKSSLSNNIDFNKGLKETTTAPKPKPKPNPKPKSPQEPPAEIAVAQLDEYKKSIHPDIIAAGLSDETILQVCDGADYQKIIWASDKALKSHVKNKPGYFRRMMQLKVIRSNQVKSPQIRLEKVPYPDFYSVPKEHTDKIECYNRNCDRTTCRTILSNEKPSEDCAKYCPYLINNKPS